MKDWNDKLKELNLTGVLSSSEMMELIKYIEDLLATQKSEMIKEVEGMKYKGTPIKKGKDNFSLTLGVEHGGGYNQALDDVITKLKE